MIPADRGGMGTLSVPYRLHEVPARKGSSLWTVQPQAPHRRPMRHGLAVPPPMAPSTRALKMAARGTRATVWRPGFSIHKGALPCCAVAGPVANTAMYAKPVMRHSRAEPREGMCWMEIMSAFDKEAPRGMVYVPLKTRCQRVFGSVRLCRIARCSCTRSFGTRLSFLSCAAEQDSMLEYR